MYYYNDKMMEIKSSFKLSKSFFEIQIYQQQAALYDWDSKQKGFIISLFSYGYFCGPIGGIFTLKYGGAKIFGLGVISTAILSALSPFLLRFHFSYFAAARVLEGLFEVSFLIHTYCPPNFFSSLEAEIKLSCNPISYCSHYLLQKFTIRVSELYALGKNQVFDERSELLYDSPVTTSAIFRIF